MGPLLLTETQTAIDGVTTAITAGAQSAADGAIASISATLPIAMTVIAAGLVITLGIKFFKRVTGKA